MGLNPPLVAPYTMPPAAVTATPMPKVSAATRFTSIPISVAAVWSCMVARTLRPNLVRYSSRYSATTRATARANPYR